MTPGASLGVLRRHFAIVASSSSSNVCPNRWFAPSTSAAPLVTSPPYSPGACPVSAYCWVSTSSRPLSRGPAADSLISPSLEIPSFPWGHGIRLRSTSPFVSRSCTTWRVKNVRVLSLQYAGSSGRGDMRCSLPSSPMPHTSRRTSCWTSSAQSFASLPSRSCTFGS